MPEFSKDWTLIFAKAAGGSLKSCVYKGHPILRTAVSAHDPRDSAAFPMVPFIGRITHGRFVFEGQNIQLAPNMPPEPHAIHGRGWHAHWETTLASNGQTALTHAYNGDGDWPWAYTATQRFAAFGNRLILTMALTNNSDRAMPAGLGWHPYFPRDGALLQADVTKVWSGSAGDIIGSRPHILSEDTDLRALRPANSLNLDHCYSAGDGGVRITWPARKLSLDMHASAALRHLTVYTPPGEDYFCVEPVSHAPDAVNNTLPADQTGLQILAPNETLEADITLTVTLD